MTSWTMSEGTFVYSKQVSLGDPMDRLPLWPCGPSTFVTLWIVYLGDPVNCLPWGPCDHLPWWPCGSSTLVTLRIVYLCDPVDRLPLWPCGSSTFVTLWIVYLGDPVDLLPWWPCWSSTFVTLCSVDPGLGENWPCYHVLYMCHSSCYSPPTVTMTSHPETWHSSFGPVARLCLHHEGQLLHQIWCQIGYICFFDASSHADGIAL